MPHGTAGFKNTDQQRLTRADSVAASTPRYPDEHLCDALRDAACLIGGGLTANGYYSLYAARRVTVSPRTFLLRFGSWSAAMHAAGLPSVAKGPYRSRIPDEDLLAAVRDCAAQNDRIPTLVEYREWARETGAPCDSLIRGRLGGWRVVLRRLSAEAD